MDKDREKNGYSDALGGYGVPAQTGNAYAPPKPRRTKAIIIISVIAAVAVALAILHGTGVIEWSRYADSIATIEKETLEDAAVNYYPVLSEEVDWTSASDGERAGIAKYAVSKALKQARDEQVANFNIMGLTPNRDPVFLYHSDTDSIQIYVSGTVKDKIPLK